MDQRKKLLLEAWPGTYHSGVNSSCMMVTYHVSAAGRSFIPIPELPLLLMLTAVVRQRRDPFALQICLFSRLFTQNERR